MASPHRQLRYIKSKHPGDGVLAFYAPLYLRRVARPPRMWRWDLFSSRMAFACV